MLLTWYEDRAEFFNKKLHGFVSKICPWTKKSEGEEAEFKGMSSVRMADAGRLVQSAITLCKVAQANKPEESQKQRAEAKRD